MAGRRSGAALPFRIKSMGVLVFRDGSFGRLKEGVVSGGDLLGLDREKDRQLIEWLLHMVSGSKRKEIMRRYGMDELPEETVNTDDPADTLYRTYFVLREQVMREKDEEVLKEAAFGNRREIMGRFAFCRLTGSVEPVSDWIWVSCFSFSTSFSPP